MTNETRTSENAEDDFVEVRRYAELPPAEIARTLLEAEGITAFVSGGDTRAVLPFTGAVELILMVPSSKAAQARELLDAIEQAQPVAEAGPPEVEDEDEVRAKKAEAEADARDPERPSTRLRRVAVVCAFFLPGGANFYARHGILGLTLIFALAACVFSFGAIGFAVGYACVVAADIALGLGSVRRCNEGRVLSPVQQLWLGLLAWAPIAGLAWLLARSFG